MIQVGKQSDQALYRYKNILWDIKCKRPGLQKNKNHLDIQFEYLLLYKDNMILLNIEYNLFGNQQKKFQVDMESCYRQLLDRQTPQSTLYN